MAHNSLLSYIFVPTKTIQLTKNEYIYKILKIQEKIKKDFIEIKELNKLKPKF